MKYRRIWGFFFGFLFGAYWIGEYSGKLLEKKEKQIKALCEDKFFLAEWLEMSQSNKSIAYYISEKGYRNIAIYGLGVIGRRLLDELMDTGVCVKYAVDKNADIISDMVEIKNISDKLEHVDAMIVTAIPFYDEIYTELYNKVDFPIVNLTEFLAPEYNKNSCC